MDVEARSGPRASRLLRVLLAGLTLAGPALCGCAGPNVGGPGRGGPGFLHLVTGQPATFVIGQPRLDAAEAGPERLQLAWGNASVLDGRFFIADTAANRIWMFDSVPDATRVLPDAVLGQASPERGENTPFSWPQSIQYHEGKYFVSEVGPGVVSIWDELPTGARDPADGTRITGLSWVMGLTIVEGTMVATSEDGVRIWRTVPLGGAADDGAPVRIRQAGGIPLNDAGKHWTDGRRLLVAEQGNHRVLGWNTLPTRDDQEPDFVLGQRAVDCGGNCAPGTTRTTLRSPCAVVSNGTQIFVKDNHNNRVMIWNAFPTRSGAPADVVLGQPDFESRTCRPLDAEGRTSADSVCEGYGIFVWDGKLFVADQPGEAFFADHQSGNGSGRWLVFTSQEPSR